MDFQQWAVEHGVFLTPVQTPCFHCEQCGCLFNPDLQNGNAVYPDRFAYVGTGISGCDVECICHELPYEQEIDEEDLPDGD